MGCAPLLTSYAQGRPPCCPEARDADCVKQPGHDAPTAATTQLHHHHRDRGTPSASPTTIVDQGRPQHRAEASDAEFVGRSGHDPPTATTTTTTAIRATNHTSHSHCRPGPRASTLRTGARRRPPNIRTPQATYHQDHTPPPRPPLGGTNSTPHYHRRQEKAPASRRSA